MNKKTWFHLILIGILFITGVSWAAKPSLGEITPGSYQLVPITNHTPYIFKKGKDYWNSLQKVELEIGKQEQFKDLPKLGMKKPFTGTILLGDAKIGVIVDIMGEEKRLYVDADGDGSFAGEHWVPLLNEWLGKWWSGTEGYLVIAPEPLRVTATYKDKPGQHFPLEISVVEGVLSKPGVLVKEKPYLLVSVKTWFLAKVTEDGAEKYMAIIDHNNNGRFNDPEDLFLIDYNDDDQFTYKEAIQRKKGVQIKSGKQDLLVDWDEYPEQLVIRKKEK